ncbi:hypothetical protein [Chryseobacterium sp. PCH239]|uniref:hypothetical protein n=1 Tax=Chryseobacterium sp. PCH239 TaxID=2825845 RepID=UPI00209DD97A|nr:hypothetical protein [Chryseobacterium sp. PCH239]
MTDQYPAQNVGARNHNELWVPSEDLNSFNKAIVGDIKVIKVFIGDDFKKAASADLEDLMIKIKKLTMTNKGMAKDTLDILAKNIILTNITKK